MVSTQQIETIRIPVGDMVFDALAAGPVDGEPVLLLHGFPQTSFAYRHQLRALAAEGYRAVAPDQRGYSPDARPADAAAYAMGNLVGDVLGIADALGYETFHLVGHDWGGAVAWVTALRAPHRLRTMSVLSTPHVTALAAAIADPASGQADRSAYMQVFAADKSEQRFLVNDAAMLRGIYSGSNLTDDEIQVYVDALGTPEAMRAALNWYTASAPRPGAAGPSTTPPITVPTTYVWSTDDIAFTRAAAEATAHYVDGPYTFEVLEGVSHWVMEQAHAEITRIILERVSGS